MSFTPEDRQRIYEEEKVRAEARAQIEQEQRDKDQQARNQMASDHMARLKRHRTKIIALVCAFLSLVTFTAWKIWTAWMNAELIANLQASEVSVGASPSDDDWKVFFGRAVVVSSKDANYRDAAMLFMKSLTYAVDTERQAASYAGVGENLTKLGLIAPAETYLRKAAYLKPKDDLYQERLADVFVKTGKYAEAESLYVALLARTSDPQSKWGLCLDLTSLMELMGRKSEAAKYRSEEEAAYSEMTKK